MTFDQRWDAVHRERQWATNPCEHLCRFVGMNYPGGGQGRHALDIGCGVGAQSLHLAICGFNVDGIDGSSTAIANSRITDITSPPRFSTTVHLQVADMVELPFEAGRFNLAVDVASLQCLDHADAIKALAEVHRVLKPGGYLFSYTSRFGTSMSVHKGMPVRSMTRKEVDAVYGGIFDLVSVDADVHTRENGAIEVRHWIVVARKTN